MALFDFPDLKLLQFPDPDRLEELAVACYHNPDLSTFYIEYLQLVSQLF